MLTDDSLSVEDFMRQLEERERDLHITADLSIEIDDSEFDPQAAYANAINAADAADGSAGPSADPVADAASVQPDQSSPSSGGTGLKTQVYELRQEIAKLNRRIEELKAERNEIQEKSDRRLKDFESFKYRVDREKRGAFIEQISNLAMQMLPVLDNLDRAIDSASGPNEEKSEDFRRFFDGIVLVNQQVRDVFADMGVEPIAAVGREFDPNLHEAVAIAEDPGLPPNTIVEELLRGYRIGNRVIRHSMVKVSPAAGSRRAGNDLARSEPGPENEGNEVTPGDDPAAAIGDEGISESVEGPSADR